MKIRSWMEYLSWTDVQKRLIYPGETLKSNTTKNKKIGGLQNTEDSVLYLSYFSLFTFLRFFFFLLFYSYMDYFKGG